ncbi:MAG: hypothetical protein MUF38_06475 [Anaerolineae bacterium]|jgi:hypothetical protein|nr:hypothetical protein [Anaerolineae bacterium]
MTDQMPDFDSMTPEEMMAWMEALAVRQGATEGIINDVSNVELAEIDPDSVDIKDEYIPFGMDPEVWAQKKAKEDAEKAERIARMKSEREAAKGGAPATQPAAASSAPTPQPEPEPEPMSFMDSLAGGDDSAAGLLDDLFQSTDALEPAEVDAVPSAVMGDGLDFLSDLGAASGAGMDDLGSLDFSGLDALGADEPAAAASLDWLESIVSDSQPVETVSEPEPELDFLPGTEMEGLSETAVGRILDDPMDWLSDFAEDKPMLATPAPMNLDALFDEQDSPPAASFDPQTDEIRSAIKEGTVQPDDVKSWMDSMLDKGLSRTDVVDEEEDDELPVKGELPDWLKAGAPSDLDAVPQATVADDSDLPDWLTDPVTDEQTAEFEAIFSEAAAQPETPVSHPTTLDDSPGLGLLDTGAIQVEMNDPWVEAFELERSEKMGDTDQLAAWYNEAKADLKIPTDAVETINSGDREASLPAPVASLKPADLSPENDLPAGEPQSVPDWMGGEPAAGSDSMGWAAQPEPTSASVAADDDLPDWLRPAAEEPSATADEVPDWLAGRTTVSPQPITEEEESYTEVASITSRPTVELPRAPRTSSSPATVMLSPSEVSELLNSARGSLKLGDVAASLSRYESLIRAQAVLDDVTSDLSNLSREPAHKGNPAVLRVYGDALMRQGKLQAALDTYRAALNLL